MRSPYAVPKKGSAGPMGYKLNAFDTFDDCTDYDFHGRGALYKRHKTRFGKKHCDIAGKSETTVSNQ